MTKDLTTSEPQVGMEVAAFEHVPKTRVQQIIDAFSDMVGKIDPIDAELRALITDIGEGEPSDAHVKKAKVLWGEYQELYKEIEGRRKEEKEVYRRVAEAIDAYAKIFTGGLVEGKTLSKKIIDHAKIKEQERKAVLQEERMAVIKDFVPPGFARDLSEMAEDVFEAYVTKLKADYEAQKAEEEKHKRAAEEARLKYQLAQDRMRELALYAAYLELPDLGSITDEAFAALLEEGKRKKAAADKEAKAAAEREAAAKAEAKAAEREAATRAENRSADTPEPLVDLPSRLEYVEMVVERLPNGLSGEEEKKARQAAKLIGAAVHAAKARYK